MNFRQKAFVFDEDEDHCDQHLNNSLTYILWAESEIVLTAHNFAIGDIISKEVRRFRISSFSVINWHILTGNLFTCR